MNIDGVILLNKRPGFTSFDELRYLKRRYGFSKIGHAGTLDSFAEGLLIVLLGYMTKFNQYFLPLEKQYAARFYFGKETDTLDPEGKIITETSVPVEQSVRNICKSYTGTINQVPPIYSAVHVNGERAYRRARAGKQTCMPKRTVTISDFQLLSWEPPEGYFIIRCSKGTYVRSLARDIAHEVGSSAYVSYLFRQRIGGFSVEDATRADKIDPHVHVLSPDEALSRVFTVEQAVASNDTARKVSHGMIPSIEEFLSYSMTKNEQAFIHVTDTEGNTRAWYKRNAGTFHSVYVIPGELV